MARRRWTLMNISAKRWNARRRRVRQGFARGVFALALLAFAGLISIGAQALAGPDSAGRAAVLSAENRALEAELTRMRSTVDTLRRSLADLAVKDQYFRLLAGVEPIHPDVHQVGIGGPGSTVETHPLYPVDEKLAEDAFSISAELSTLLRRARLLRFSWREAKDTLQQKYDRLAATPSILPTDGTISSVFSHKRWHPILGRPRPHLGLDIVAPRGTPIVAAAKGTVRFVGKAGEYGLTVEIDHGFGFITRYAHAARTLVRLGQPVERGDLIALVGQSGLAIGPHLHYEVWVGDRADDPRKYILETTVVPD